MRVLLSIVKLLDIAQYILIASYGTHCSMGHAVTGGNMSNGGENSVKWPHTACFGTLRGFLMSVIYSGMLVPLVNVSLNFTETTLISE